MYMHIASHGDAVQMAKAIHDAVALTKTPGPDATPAAQPTAELGFDQKQVEQILGHTGKVNGGILQFGIPRAESIKDSGMTVPPSMGRNRLNSNRQETAGGSTRLCAAQARGTGYQRCARTGLL
jgi:hypothetical protein